MNDKDQVLKRLLQAGGKRPQPPADLRQDVYTAVHAEWESLHGKKRGRLFWPGLAAMLVVTLMSLYRLVDPTGNQTSITFATIARSSHPVDIQRQSSALALAEGNLIQVGDQFTSRKPVALAAHNGITVRVDAHSSVLVEAPHRLALQSGAVFVESHGLPNADLTVVSGGTEIAHIGTRYLIEALDNNTFRVSVRDGAVQLNKGASVVGSGESALVDDGGVIQRERIVPHDGRWEWIHEATPALELNGMSLLEFLRWYENETGRAVRFSSTAAHHEAASVVLSGSTDGLSPDEALAAVLVSSGYRIKSNRPEAVTLDFENQTVLRNH